MTDLRDIHNACASHTPTPDSSARSVSTHRRATSRRIASVVLASALCLGVVACGDADDDAAVGSDTTTTTASADSNTSPTTTTGSSGEEPDTQDVVAVWPLLNGDTFDDPVAAATSFAVDLARFTDPIVGEFMQGDNRSGEVEVRATDNGPTTTVMVRLDADDHWVVIGAATSNIVPDQPTGAVTSPVTVSGTSTAFEATVDVAVYDRDSTAPLVRTFVMGGSMGDMGPFSQSIEFEDPTTPTGTILYWTTSAKDGSVSEAAAVTVSFG